MTTRILKMLLWGVLVLAAFGTAVMLLWNFVVAATFGIATVNFWQALGLLVLSRILFGGFGRFGHGRMRGDMPGRGKNPFHDKWMKMTPEERKEFINKRKKFGFGGPFGGRGFFDDGRFDGCGHQPFGYENEESKKENE